MTHTKREIRQLVLSALNGEIDSSPFGLGQLRPLEIAVARALYRRQDQEPELNEADWLYFNEVFWDLVIERKITPGLNRSNQNLPWFRKTSGNE